MAGKKLAIVLIIVLVASMSTSLVLSGDILGPKTSDSNKYAGYTEMQLSSDTEYSCNIGGYNYVFTYYPTTDIKGNLIQGYLSISREGVSTPSEFPLTTNTLYNYYGVTLAITQVDPTYIILMVNAS